MPYPNEHSARIKNPASYVRFRRQNNKFGAGIHAIWGIKSDDKVELQAIRFSKNKFTVAQAKKWLKDHDYKPISFEPASGGKIMPQSILEENQGQYISKTLAIKEDTPDGIIPFRLTELKVDRQGEVVKPDGAVLKDYRDNPIVLFAHGYGEQGQIPVGKILPDTFDKTKQYLDANVEFDLKDAFANMIYNKLKDGFLSTGSIGFKPITISKEPILPQQTGVTHEKWELLEFSVVPIPSLTSARVHREYEEFKTTCREYGHCFNEDYLVPKLYDEYEFVIKKELEPDINTKEGRVLSGKNRKIIQNSVSAMKEAIEVLDSLLEVTESEKVYVSYKDFMEKLFPKELNGKNSSLIERLNQMESILRHQMS